MTTPDKGKSAGAEARPTRENAATAEGVGNYRIDTHAHFLPVEFADVVRSHEFNYVPPWTPEQHIDFMDAWHIQAAVISASIYFDFGDRAETAATARLLNKAGRGLLEKYPDRFGPTVTLPLPYVDLAVAELEYALDTLNLDNGVMLFAHYGGVYLGDPSYDALYRALDERRSVAWIHPSFPDQFPGVRVPTWGPASPFSGQVLEFPFETTRAASNIIYHGILTRYPNIRWQLSHSGGALPLTLTRLALMQTLQGNEISGSEVPGPFTAAKQFYCDTAVSATPGELTVAKTAVGGTPHIVFGTDWPFTAIFFAPDAARKYPWLVEFLPRHGDPQPALSSVFMAAERMSVDRETALRLYPGLAGRVAAD
jgi:6-methylsalicylate decarboxylase